MLDFSFYYLSFLPRSVKAPESTSRFGWHATWLFETCSRYAYVTPEAKCTHFRSSTNPVRAISDAMMCDVCIPACTLRPDGRAQVSASLVSHVASRRPHVCRPRVAVSVLLRARNQDCIAVRNWILQLIFVYVPVCFTLERFLVFKFFSMQNRRRWRQYH